MAYDTTANQVIVVTGAYGGIGQEVCRQLATEGHAVVAAGRDGNRLAALAHDVGIASVTIPDFADWDALDAAFDGIRKDHGKLDGIVHATGSLLLKSAHRTSRDEYDHTIATNLTTAFGVVRAAGRIMRRDGGSVALVSSAAAQLGLPNHEVIAAAKAGIEGLVRSAAASYASQGIRFNAVAPGLTRTPMTAHLTANDLAEKTSSEMHALGRLGEPGEVASALVWLVTQSWVTGQILGVDGGLAKVMARRPAVRQ